MKALVRVEKDSANSNPSWELEVFETQLHRELSVVELILDSPYRRIAIRKRDWMTLLRLFV